jgi:hypothetical protein
VLFDGNPDGDQAVLTPDHLNLMQRDLDSLSSI